MTGTASHPNGSQYFSSTTSHAFDGNHNPVLIVSGKPITRAQERGTGQKRLRLGGSQLRDVGQALIKIDRLGEDIGATQHQNSQGGTGGSQTDRTTRRDVYFGGEEDQQNISILTKEERKAERDAAGKKQLRRQSKREGKEPTNKLKLNLGGGREGARKKYNLEAVYGKTRGQNLSTSPCQLLQGQRKMPSSQLTPKKGPSGGGGVLFSSKTKFTRYIHNDKRGGRPRAAGSSPQPTAPQPQSNLERNLLFQHPIKEENERDFDFSGSFTLSASSKKNHDERILLSPGFLASSGKPSLSHGIHQDAEEGRCHQQPVQQTISSYSMSPRATHQFLSKGAKEQHSRSVSVLNNNSDAAIHRVEISKPVEHKLLDSFLPLATLRTKKERRVSVDSHSSFTENDSRGQGYPLLTHQSSKKAKIDEFRRKIGNNSRWLSERPDSPTTSFLQLLENEESDEKVMDSLVGLLGLRREETKRANLELIPLLNTRGGLRYMAALEEPRLVSVINKK